MSGDEQRARNLFSEIVGEIRDKLEGIDQKMRALDPKIMDISKRLMTHVRSKCAEQFEWLEKNSSKTSDGQMELNSSIPPAEAEKRFQELSACTDKQDHGLRIFFNDMNDKQTKIQDATSNCMEKCYSESNQKPDQEVKDCFKGCFTTTLNDMNNLHFSIEEKLTETNKRI
jgi:hypothetical protein